MTPEQIIDCLFEGFNFSKVMNSHRDSDLVRPQGSIGALLDLNDGEVFVYADSRQSGIKGVSCTVNAIGDDAHDKVVYAQGTGNKFLKDARAFNDKSSAILTADFYKSDKSPEDYLKFFGSEVFASRSQTASSTIPLDAFVAKLREITDSK